MKQDPPHVNERSPKGFASLHVGACEDDQSAGCVLARRPGFFVEVRMHPIMRQPCFFRYRVAVQGFFRWEMHFPLALRSGIC